MVLDPRHLSCPACFDGTQEGTSGGSSSSRGSQLLTHASETLPRSGAKNNAIPTDRSPAGRRGEESPSHAL